MNLSLEESKELCDWLIERGLNLCECAWVMADIACGDTFSVALLKVYKQRRENLEALNEEVDFDDWGIPITG